MSLAWSLSRWTQAEQASVAGDPVFSNALFTKDNTVVFIDVRGRQGDVLSLRGDALYDLAKVYQSCAAHPSSFRACTSSVLTLPCRIPS